MYVSKPQFNTTHLEKSNNFFTCRTGVWLDPFLSGKRKITLTMEGD
jgi:hypothetical protein